MSCRNEVVGIASEGSQHWLRMGKQQDPQEEVKVPLAGWYKEWVAWQQGWQGTQEQWVPACWMAAWRAGSSEAMVVAGPTAPDAIWVLTGGHCWESTQ